MRAWFACRRLVENTTANENYFYGGASNWQLLEEHRNGQVYASYVWDPGYIDGLILRDRDADSSLASGLEERVYVMQDANMNVTAVADETGAILERYRYDPYGNRTVLDADFTDDADAVSDVEMLHGHQGGRYVEALDAYHFRHRFYSPELQRWLNPDPAGYVDGPNAYAYVMNDPVSYRDPMGLETEGDDELLALIASEGFVMGGHYLEPSTHDKRAEIEREMAELNADLDNRRPQVIQRSPSGRLWSCRSGAGKLCGSGRVWLETWLKSHPGGQTPNIARRRKPRTSKGLRQSAGVAQLVERQLPKR